MASTILSMRRLIGAELSLRQAQRSFNWRPDYGQGSVNHNGHAPVGDMLADDRNYGDADDRKRNKP
jgi:hypothetical protein